MLKFIIPAILIFLIVLFWERISTYIFEKTKIKINYIVIIILFIILMLISTLLYF